MRIIFSSNKGSLLSEGERRKILEMMQGYMGRDLDLSVKVEAQGVADNSKPVFTLTAESLLNDLTELQFVALKTEEEVARLKEQNNYLEEKVNWLRGKAGEINSIPSKAKPESRSSSDNSRLRSALVTVINAMESKVRRSMVFSFSTSKRVRKDKALISKSEYFDLKYVTSQLKQLGLQVRDPLEFFVSYGAALELSPSEKFDTKSYLAMNPDVKNSGINPLLHYIKHGKAEGRVLI